MSKTSKVSSILSKNSHFRRQNNKRRLASLDELFPSKTKRLAREKVAIGVPKYIPLDYAHHVKDGGNIYISTAGAHIVIGADHVLVKLPYGISANDIWRATIDDSTGKQRNSLSESARNYKKMVRQIYQPLLKAIDYRCIAALSEVRLIIQPPTRTKQYSAATYPRFDIDNYPKLLIDSLKGLIFKDDNIFIEEKIKLAEPVEKGCVWLSCIVKQPEDIHWIKQAVSFDWLSGKKDCVEG